MHKCEICNYKTERQDNLKRHLDSNKHKKNMILKEFLKEEIKINDDAKEENEEDNDNYIECLKCNKKYVNKRCLKKHEIKCNGLLDNLTCKRCMKTFNDNSYKNKHCKKNNCKPISIFEYLKRNNIITEDINSGDNNTIINSNSNNTNNTNNSNNTNSNNITNSNNTNNITNIYINDYGKERIDFITYDDFLEIVKCCNNSIIPKYIKLKHFNPNFPENHNIKYKNNIFFIKRNKVWTIINSNTLSNKLYNDGGSDIFNNLTTYNDNIKNDVTKSRYEDIKVKADYADLELQGHDKDIKRQLIDVVKDMQI